jgi:hypothetical protein
MKRRSAALVGVLAAVSLATAQRIVPLSHSVDVLTPESSLPARFGAQLLEPIGCAQTSTGEYVILDRRAHTLYGVDAARTTIRKILQVGFEQGQVIQPGAMGISASDVIAVSDAPAGYERIQYFDVNGAFQGGFYLKTPATPRLVAGRVMLNGVGSMQFTGTSFLVNQPETSSLIQEIDLQGHERRRIGTLRFTGHERDPAVHLAMNTGIPLVDPTGGFVFVFQAGVPAFRKYDATGALVYERHIEGVELDEALRSLPAMWPRPADTLPIIEPLIRAAAIDARGTLWVSLTRPYTYVYDAAGDKVRTVQFRGAALISPTSLTFTRKGRLLVTPGCETFESQK